MCEKAMALHDDVANLRAQRMAAGGEVVPLSYQGVTKVKVRDVLTKLHLGQNAELVDCVFALLDDETPSWFPRAVAGTTFSDGATTAHLACHVGVLQRGVGKMDREGRDYWIKPLSVLGGIESVYLHQGQFIEGHPVAKSGNSAYRLSEVFKAILRASDNEWPGLLTAWASQEAARQRREYHAQVAEISRQLVDTGHSDLIRASVEHYATRFLRGYEVIYVDDGDGDRITERDRTALRRAGVELRLGDAMPDVLLWNPATDRLWVIEAVTSDGEVDLHKVNQLTALADRCGKAGVDFTTTYQTWRQASTRQGAHNNVAVGSFIWIQADPSKHFRVESFE